MTFNPTARRSLTAIGALSAAFAVPFAAQAQVAPVPAPITPAEVQALPADLQSAPVVSDFTETNVGPDGVETIVRTRRIETSVPHTGQAFEEEYVEYAPHTQGYTTYAPQPQGYTPAYAPVQGYAPGAAVFEREQWLDECENRTNGRSDGEKGGIIGGLLGAITGGIIGNRVADAGDRLAGTLIGGGIGGLSGVLLGSLIGGGRNDRGEYDCEAALDSYLSQYGHTGAARVIPAPTYAPTYAAPPVQYGYGAPAYPAYNYSYSYAPPQQIVYVPIRYEVQQRVVVRETVREELVPGATRTIPAPAPAPAPRPAPLRLIKGN